LQEEIVQCKIEIKSRNKHITELEVNIQQYKDQINDLQNTILDMQQSKTQVITVGSYWK
jgi:prefoldin subunit 5